MDVQYHFPMDEMTPTQWIARCAERLHERWQTVETAQLEEVAMELWKDPRLRRLPPLDAAIAWLSPLEVRSEEAP